MATPGSSFTSTPLGHEDNLEVPNSPRAVEFLEFRLRCAIFKSHCPVQWKHLRYPLSHSMELSRVPMSSNSVYLLCLPVVPVTSRFLYLENIKS
ncbi:hypothetical protein TNCV_214571 [Trichonephila clavipes]|nr:hypothetical protein TNCV_214571 [Trichonephila clavipes]